MSEELSPRLLEGLPASLQAEGQAPPARALAMDRTTGQWREVPAESVWRIRQPADLDADQILVLESAGAWKLALPARYGFALSRLGEAAPGKLAGHLGVPVEAAAQAGLQISAEGALLCLIRREEGDRLRVSLHRSRRKEAGLTLRAAVSARLEAGPEERELLAALLEAHPWQWLETFLREATRGRADQRLVRLAEWWNSLEARAAAAIWRAAGDVDALRSLGAWVHRLAQISDPQALARLLETEPPAAGSPAEAWIEAAAGPLLGILADQTAFKRVRAAAQAAEGLWSEESLRQTLAELKRRAAEQAAQALAGAIPEDVRRFAAQVGAKALEALENKYSIELSYAAGAWSADTALLDCSFDFSEAGLKAYRAALEGDLTAALGQGEPHVRLYLGLLTHGVRRHSRLELALPFLDRKQWSRRWEALAQVRIEPTLDGRLLAYTLEASDETERRQTAQSAMNLCAAFVLRPGARDTRFSLSWSDRRRLTPAQARSALPALLKAYRLDAALDWLAAAPADACEIQTDLTLTVPGETAAAWLQAPVERSPEYGPVYTEVSVAVQQALRRWLPQVYFSDLSRYDTLGAAYPLVVYQCTLPFRSKAKNEFAYDVMSAESVAVARRSTSWALAAELARIEQLLLEAGKPETARFYRPTRKDVILAGVERAPRLFHALLVADAQFIDYLIRLGVRAGGLRRALEREPQRALRELTRFGEEFVKTFHRRLKRLYGGEDFTSFGALILVEATGALSRALGAAGGVSGVLRMRVDRREGAPLEGVFTNADYRS